MIGEITRRCPGFAHHATPDAGTTLDAVSARAGIIVTGTEVLSGRITDKNGPWVSARLLELGVDVAHITICGDRPDDLTAQLDFLTAQGVDPCLLYTSPSPRD